MLRKFLLALLAIVLVCVAYLLFWPVSVSPVAWQAPPNPGYTGPYTPNDDLSAPKKLPLDGRSGPESAAVAENGDVYFSTRQGHIMRLDASTAVISDFADTGGRPLGLDFAPDGRLFVADALRGLLAIDPKGSVSLVADKDGHGGPIRYADDVAVAADGTVYLSDASTKFGARANGGPLAASERDLMEHGGHGRVLRIDPATGAVETVLDGLQFANGIALTRDQSRLLVVETGRYRVIALGLTGEKAGRVETVIDDLPGLPANVDRARDGTFWLGLVSPRPAVLDALSGHPFLRTLIQRLPAALIPTPRRYGFVVHFDQDGNILETLQDPSGAYALTTGAVEGPESLLFVTSRSEDTLGVLAR